MEYCIVWEDWEGYEKCLSLERASAILKELFDMYPDGTEEMMASVRGLQQHLQKAGKEISELVTENANLRIENHKLKWNRNDLRLN